jgi:hypothetical protein
VSNPAGSSSATSLTPPAPPPPPASPHRPHHLPAAEELPAGNRRRRPLPPAARLRRRTRAGRSPLAVAREAEPARMKLAGARAASAPGGRAPSRAATAGVKLTRSVWRSSHVSDVEAVLELTHERARGGRLDRSRGTGRRQRRAEEETTAPGQGTGGGGGRRSRAGAPPCCSVCTLQAVRGLVSEHYPEVEEDTCEGQNSHFHMWVPHVGWVEPLSANRIHPKWHTRQRITSVWHTGA